MDINYKVCDHCGKQLVEFMTDYPDLSDFGDLLLDAPIMTLDLCGDCYHELEEVILKFVNKEDCKEK